ncbi:MAG: YraN family protein [Candidatus Omnitrophica bacterium]|nr:YraN family protein [Candidatus Omnitrophota bacterium]MBI3020754.1 YraN family protein [Candidatus Omnitrophota bacterium]MBI3083069.1 YraN family protein [Candidatus Omnitrophota bacterium]
MATEPQRRLNGRTSSRQQLGARSEELAARVLTSRGYRIAARNVRYPVGELDLVAWDGDTLCFVEVRATSSSQWGGGLASITPDKRRRLIRAARWYLARGAEPPREVRFDVVAIQWDVPASPTSELVQGAFTAD